jgi:hypothetical protein
LWATVGSIRSLNAKNERKMHWLRTSNSRWTFEIFSTVIEAAIHPRESSSSNTNSRSLANSPILRQPQQASASLNCLDMAPSRFAASRNCTGIGLHIVVPGRPFSSSSLSMDSSLPGIPIALSPWFTFTDNFPSIVSNAKRDWAAA